MPWWMVCRCPYVGLRRHDATGFPTGAPSDAPYVGVASLGARLAAVKVFVIIPTLIFLQLLKKVSRQLWVSSRVKITENRGGGLRWRCAAAEAAVATTVQTKCMSICFVLRWFMASKMVRKMV